MMTPQQVDEFRSAGFVLLKRAVPADVVEEMVDRVWMLMNKQGLQRDDPDSWRRVVPYSDIRGVSHLQQMRHDTLGPEGVASVKQALDQVFAGSVRGRAKHWGQTLVTLPADVSEWSLPHGAWHFDHLCRQPSTISGVNVFLLMDDVDPGGGGTAVLRNSPLLMEKFLAANPAPQSVGDQNKRFLQFEPWLRGLNASVTARGEQRNRRYLDEDTIVHGVPVRIEEVHGRAGDVCITHPALLHAPAMNVTGRPRLMRTQRVYAGVPGKMRTGK